MAEKAPGYSILTWGCQMNEEDSEQMALYLEGMGYRAVGDPADADVVLLNTCSVRHKPEEKVYSKLGELRLLKASRPDVVIGVCGCMAQVESAQIRRRAPFVDLVIGTASIASIPALVSAARARHHIAPQATASTAVDTPHAPLPGDPPLRRSSAATRARVGPLESLALPPRRGAVVGDVPARNVARRATLRTYVPIMYGCDKFCTFCIVPLTRGRERSRPSEEILAEIRGLASGGTREVTLLGQTVNSYGKNLPEGRVPFARLLEQIDAIPGIERIRFTSPYPRDFTDDLIDTMARLPSVCEHVHLPLQVADNHLLAHMHRGYTVERYRGILSRLRETIPGIAITTDVMLGYPGETDEQFENTLRFVAEARFDAAFMFAYSPRPGTKAAEMPQQVPQEVKVERLTRLIDLQNGISLEINRAQVGQTFEVLVEGPSPRDPARMTGLTRTFKTTNFPGADRLIGQFARVRVTEGHITGFTGELSDQSVGCEG